jgi:hypothetical protein
MSMRMKFLPISSMLLAAAGVLVAGIGIYFIFLRQPLLIEDILYLHLSTAELAAIGPRLEPWLTQVFRVLGGYALATGLLTVALATTAFRARQPAATAGAFIAGASSIGLMTVVNFAIDSDFKWQLFGVALVWSMSAVAFGAEAWVARSAARASTGRGHAA